MLQIRLAGEITTDSIVDGEGIRSVIWTQGCTHNCKGCHNPETHSFNAGFLKDVSEVCEEIRKLEFQDGITLSGGDPLCQIEACAEIAKFCQSIGLNVWCYTGYTIESLLKRIKTEQKLKEIYTLRETIKFLEDPRISDVETQGYQLVNDMRSRMMNRNTWRKNKSSINID